MINRNKGAKYIQLKRENRDKDAVKIIFKRFFKFFCERFFSSSEYDQAFFFSTNG